MRITGDGNVLLHIRRDGKNITPPLASKYHPEIQNPTDKHPGEIEEAKGCAAMVQSEPQLLITNNLIAANMLTAFYNIVDEGQYEKVIADPENHAEVYCDVTSLKCVPRTRKV